MESRKNIPENWAVCSPSLSRTIPMENSYTKSHFLGLSLFSWQLFIQLRHIGRLRLMGTNWCFAHGFYFLSLLLQPVTRVVAVSSTAHLDPVFLTIGIVIKKEIVLMALMNLPLVVRKQASTKSIMMQLEKHFQVL